MFSKGGNHFVTNHTNHAGGNKVLRVFRAIVEGMETILVILTVIAVVIAIVGLIPQFVSFWEERGDAEAFNHMLSAILAIVVGTEFIRMMLKPTFHNVMEVLTFLIARHMIVQETSPMDNLLSVLAIAILFFLQTALWRLQHKSEALSYLKKKVQGREDGKSFRKALREELDAVEAAVIEDDPGTPEVGTEE